MSCLLLEVLGCDSLNILWTCLFLAALGLCCCASFSLVAASRGSSLTAELGPWVCGLHSFGEQGLLSLRSLGSGYVGSVAVLSRGSSVAALRRCFSLIVELGLWVCGLRSFGEPGASLFLRSLGSGCAGSVVVLSRGSSLIAEPGLWVCGLHSFGEQGLLSYCGAWALGVWAR